jgi:hypothetical protein
MKTAEEFLREKLESEIADFGDGTAEFHTRDIAHLLQCLDEKDNIIGQTEQDFRTHFKEQGFELYKTEDLKPKLDRLEELEKGGPILTEELLVRIFEHGSDACYYSLNEQTGVVDPGKYEIFKKKTIESILSTHKTN